MGRDDWFQCTTWTATERERFEEKLARARRANRPGYLRAQGTLLTESEGPELREAGRELLGRAIRDGDGERARHWAREALDIAALDKPPAPRRPGAGLARPAREDRDEMERLAS